MSNIAHQKDPERNIAIQKDGFCICEMHEIIFWLREI